MEETKAVVINQTPGYWDKCTSTISQDKKKYKEATIDRLIARGHTPREAQLLFAQQQRLFKR